MGAKETLKKTSAAALYILSLAVLLAGYIASHTSKNGSFVIAGIVLGIALLAAAAVLGNFE